MSNFNIKLKVDKVMKIIAESKTFRNWTYLISFIILLIVLVINASDIVIAVAELIKVIN